MLFNQKHLTGIKDGNVTLAFRKWKKPSVKKGSIIKTAVGQIEIVAIDSTEVEKITNKDAQNAGFSSLDELLAQLETIENGTIYRVIVAYHSPDPRIALRNQTDITNEEFTAIKAKLERLDKHSKEGNWTHSVLRVIQKNPNLMAADLAQLLSKDKEWLKLNVRKLKNAGLTISNNPGYEISPLGNAYLKKYS